MPMTGPTPSDPTALALLRQIAALGYRVSCHRLDASLLRTFPARVEYHANDVATGEQHVAHAPADEPDAEYRAACALAQSVGIDLEG
ncbi:MAG: hypothetical protein JWO31_4051 [Phycisphaerales bacterium]|nr:hypothetical protein [Phycisphaerales bacterium]